MAQKSTFPHFATNAIHVGHDPKQWTSQSVVPGIFMSTTYQQDYPGKPTPYEYTRAGNPTRTVLQKCAASLEGAKHAFVASSGLAATSMIVQTLKSGDRILCMNDVYGGTNRYFQRVLSKFNLSATLVDATKVENVEKALEEHKDIKIVWIESPTNPTLRIVDIQAVADIVHKKPDIILVVDNTFMTPYFQKPPNTPLSLIHI